MADGKGYKVRFGSMAARSDTDKEMSFYGLEYTNQSYANLVIIQKLGKPICDEAIAKLAAVMLAAGFEQAEATATTEEKAKLAAAKATTQAQ